MMGGLFTLDSGTAAHTYALLSPQIEQGEGKVSIYSRLPMRQLLRFVASNNAEMWWISDHDGARSVEPDVPVLEAHINQHLNESTQLLVVEGIDWLVSRTGSQPTLAWLQRLHSMAIERDMDVILPVDPLSMEAQVWRRIAGLASAFEWPSKETELVVQESVEPAAIELETPTDMRVDHGHERRLTHLVNLPVEGFTTSLLSKRMLQWKRMGFDLSSLEPALSMKDIAHVHALYSTVESMITLAIDGLRLMEHHREKLSVTEREMFNFRMMTLMDVKQHIEDLEDLISTR